MCYTLSLAEWSPATLSEGPLEMETEMEEDVGLEQLALERR